MSDSSLLFSKIQAWGQSLGFSQIGVASIDLTHTHQHLMAWLERGFHGEMNYMKRHGLLRARPEELVPGTIAVITARMNYLSPSPGATPAQAKTITLEPSPVSPARMGTRDLHQQERKVPPVEHFSDNFAPGTSPTPAQRLHERDSEHWSHAEWARLESPEQAYVSLYARGKDYHKTLKRRLEQLAQHIQGEVSPMGYRVFCDSAPVMEVALAERAGLGWRGKHTLLLNRGAGSMFFLGEIFINFDLLAHMPQQPGSEHCGSCSACLQICPTQAIIAPYQLDARKCISYLTIEHPGSIDVALRPLMGNRIYGCDDCQLICPWNKFAQKTELPEFQSREALKEPSLLELWSWSEEDFLNNTQASAIRRIGHERWLRNIAIAMGNALASTAHESHKEQLQQALASRLEHPSDLVKEHVRWALEQA